MNGIELPYVEIYTDGSALKNPGPGGYGFIALKEGAEIYRESMGFVKTTNNRQELRAILHALYWAQAQKIPAVRICSDSMYCINTFQTWLAKWLDKGILGTKKNADLIALYPSYHAKFVSIEFKKVKAHSGIFWNEEVDVLARDAAIHNATNIDVGYE